MYLRVNNNEKNMSSNKKNKYNYQELEGMKDDQWAEIMAITDDQAIDSDIGGDSDADDCFDDVTSNTSSLSTRSQQTSSSELPHGSASPKIPPPAPSPQLTHGKKEQVSCPNAIIDYNKYIGGVVKFDQHMASYNISWKSRRWWMKIWFYLIEAAIVNSYIIYKDTWKKAHPSGTKPMTHLVFRSKLDNELIGEPKTFHSIQEDDDHRLIKTTKKNLRRCRYCSTALKPKRSVYECVSCDVALCVECFVPFHNSGQKKEA